MNPPYFNLLEGLMMPGQFVIFNGTEVVRVDFRLPHHKTDHKFHVPVKCKKGLIANMRKVADILEKSMENTPDREHSSENGTKNAKIIPIGNIGEAA